MLPIVTLTVKHDQTRAVRTCYASLQNILHSLGSVSLIAHDNVSVTVHTGGSLVPSRTSVTFTNIVGKIDHWDTCTILRNEVQSLALEICDGFGEFWCLFSPQCNLRVSKACTITLFRGGRSSNEILEIIENAIITDTIKSISVHMLVATARLGHPVARDCYGLVNAFAQMQMLKMYCTFDEDDITNYKGIILHSFCTDWLAKFNLPAAPTQIRLNLARTGTVNMFVSLASPLNLTPNIEFEFMPFLNHLLDFISQNT